MTSPLSHDDLFTRAFGYLLGNEGGMSDVPGDAGGRTRYGISSRTWPNVDLDSLTLDSAAELYEREYWMPYQIGSLPDRLAIKCLDTCVWMGPTVAIRMLQEACNTVHRDYTTLLDCDGRIGPATIARALQLDETAVLYQYANAIEFRAAILAERPPNRQFARGWESRAKRMPA